MTVVESGPRAQAVVVPSAVVGPVDTDGLASAASVLIEAAKNRTPEVTLVFNSPGGYVSVGYAFLELMQDAQAQGTRIRCEIPQGGMAASMAAFLFVHCDVRAMAKGAALMFHTVSASGIGGNQWDVEKVARELESTNKRLAIEISGHLSITLAQYEELVFNRDWWMDNLEGVAVGAVDEVL